jgi:hypothetical protein
MKKKPTTEVFVGSCISIALLPVINGMHNRLIPDVLGTFGIILLVGATVYALSQRIKARTIKGPTDKKPFKCVALGIHCGNMTDKRASRPRDPLVLAKLVGDIAIGQSEDKPPEAGKNANAANLGRLGGAARARTLSPEKRSELAKKAAAKRWGTKS